jgi:ParB family chromosome partitioning protein
MSGDDQFRVDWAVDAITVGARHRKDLGDVGELAASIGRVGLLQPITVNRDGVLICGARRLAAIKQLGWRTVNVWMRMGLSDKLSALMAERDDIVSHKPYTKVELAAMYTELKTEIAADAARRYQAKQYGSQEQNPCSDGLAESATPAEALIGDSRVQAARMLGGASHFTLEQIAAIQAITADERRDPGLRRRARLALERIEDGGAVDPLFRELRPAVQLDDLDVIAADETEPEQARQAARTGAALIRRYDAETPMPPEDLDKIARAALARVQAARKSKKPKDTPAAPKPAAPPPRKKTAKAFVWLWDEMADWPGDYDVAVIAEAVPDEKWLGFKRTVAASIEFMQAVDQARAARVFAG